MTKAELKNGMGVICRNGWYAFVMRDCATNRLEKDLFVFPDGGFNKMSDYADDLTECKWKESEYDIVKVVQFNTVHDMLHSDFGAAKVLWERKKEPEPKKLTIEEVAELLGYPVEIVLTKSHEYKVGDKVITTKLEDYSGCELFPVGTVCNIEDIADIDMKLPYVLKGPDGDFWYYSEDMFKPYKEV